MKITHRLLSPLSLVCCAFWLIVGCSHAPRPLAPQVISQNRQAVLAPFFQDSTQANKSRGLDAAQFIARDITARLLFDSPSVQIAIDVVPSEKILSFSYPGGLVISVGLLRRLHTESMCAFVIAHELAHHILGHLAELTENPSNLNSYNLELEMAADRRAVALMAAAAYDVRAALETFAVVGTTLHGDLEDLTLRRSKIAQFIEQSKWRPPGTVTRRSYQEMQAMLAGSAQ